MDHQITTGQPAKIQTMDHSKMNHDNMEKGKSTPKGMADHDHHKMMIADFKQRFYAVLILTIPILLLSPMIRRFIGANWQFAGSSYLLFVLSSVIFIYGGWPFLKGLATELKDKNPGMMTLIGFAISVAYIYSSATVFGLKGMDFFWELATLILIMLLGHWGIPTSACIEANIHALARYAALCQEVGIVPITEPEVLMEGDYSLQKCFDVTERTLKILFYQLYHCQIALEGMILKPNMVIAGTESIEKNSIDEVAEATVHCLLGSVPAAVPAIAFLSGGQSPEDASPHLNAIHTNFKQHLPWIVSFSFARAIQ